MNFSRGLRPKIFPIQSLRNSILVLVFLPQKVLQKRRKLALKNHGYFEEKPRRRQIGPSGRHFRRVRREKGSFCAIFFVEKLQKNCSFWFDTDEEEEQEEGGQETEVAAPQSEPPTPSLHRKNKKKGGR